MPEIFPVLETYRLELKKIEHHNSSDIFKSFSDLRVTKFYDIVPFETEDQALQLIDRFNVSFINNVGIRWGIVIKGSKNVIGSIGFNRYMKGADGIIGYDLQPSYWRMGYTTEAIQAVIKFGFNDLNLNRIEANVMQGNIASEKLLARVGFVNEGIFKDKLLFNEKYYDMTVFSVYKSYTCEL